MSWFTIAGKERPDIDAELKAGVATSFERYNFKQQGVEYINKLDRSLSLSSSEIDDQLLEKLRNITKFWDVHPTYTKITSHRKFVGPIIVKSKQILFSFLQVLLRPTFAKQRQFNAQVVEFLAELASRSNK